MHAQSHAYVCRSISVWLIIDPWLFKMNEALSFSSLFSTVLHLYLYTNTNEQGDLVCCVTGEAVTVAPGDPHVLVPTGSAKPQSLKRNGLSERQSSRQPEPAVSHWFYPQCKQSSVALLQSALSKKPHQWIWVMRKECTRLLINSSPQSNWVDF